jgi:hypothetical protein
LFFWQQARQADQGGRKQARQTRPWDAEKGGQLQAAECECRLQTECRPSAAAADADADGVMEEERRDECEW